jgi:hypothetical protein
MPRTTIAEACRQRGIDRKNWDEAKRQGVDPWDRAAMDKWISGLRHRIKPGTTIPPGTESADAQTIEEIEKALREAKDIDTVKILHEKLKGLQVALKVQRDSRELVPVGEVRQSMTRVTSAARAEILKLAADMPPRLEGLDAAGMQKILRDALHEILTRLSDETSKLYADA